jgi:hypothetical protein
MLARMNSIMKFAVSAFTSSNTGEIQIKTDGSRNENESANIQESNSIAMKSFQSLSFIHLHRRLYLSLFDPIRTSVVAPHELNRNFVIIPYNSEMENSPRQVKEKIENSEVSLAEIFNFDCMMRAVARQNPQSKLVICAGENPAARMRTVLLLGCHMVLSLGVTPDLTCSTFAHLHCLAGCPIPAPDDKEDNVWCGEMTASSCWDALAFAKVHRWIDFDCPFVVGEEVLCVEEYLHYSE